MHDAGIVEDMPEIHVTAQTYESCELEKQHRQSFSSKYIQKSYSQTKVSPFRHL